MIHVLCCVLHIFGCLLMFSYFSCRTGAYEVVCHCTLARFQPDSSVICQDLKNQQPFSILVMPPVLQIAFFWFFHFVPKKRRWRPVGLGRYFRSTAVAYGSNVDPTRKPWAVPSSFPWALVTWRYMAGMSYMEFTLRSCEKLVKMVTFKWWVFKLSYIHGKFNRIYMNLLCT